MLPKSSFLCSAKNQFCVLILVAGFLSSERLAWPQANSATLYGTVTDPSGAAVPNATVTLIQQATQATNTKVTGVSGDFGFTFIPAGAYTLQITAQGFAKYFNNGVLL